MQTLRYSIFLAFFCSMHWVVAQKASDDAVGELFRLEQQFSEASEKNGFRMANLQFAADDATVFRPFRINAKEWSHKLKGTDSSYQVTWYASLIEMSAAGDFGYATGPFKNVTIQDGKTTTYRGQFVTVWERQVNGELKFIMDYGSNILPLAEPFIEEPLFKIQKKSRKSLVISNNVSELRVVMSVDSAYSKACVTNGDFKAIEKFADRDIRLLYQREFYARGIEKIKSKIGKQVAPHRWVDPIFKISKSGDIAHVFGKFSYLEEGHEREGYFMRIWKRIPSGKWKLAMQVSNKVPKGSKAY